MNKDRFWLIFKEFLVILLIIVFIRGFVLIPVGVIGNSMKNLLHPDDYVLMEKFSKIKRNDVVVLKDSNGNHLIKRVVALPGENIKVVKDTLFIDEKKQSENFLKKQKQKDQSGIPYTADFSLEELTGKKTLSKNEYFVMGDNRRMSKDSRDFGPVKKSEIIGKARLVYFPLKHFGWIK